MLVTQPTVCGGLSSEDGGRMKSPRDKVQPSGRMVSLVILNWVRTSEKLECDSSLASWGRNLACRTVEKSTLVWGRCCCPVSISVMLDELE